MNNLSIIWSADFDIRKGYQKNKEHEHIVSFIHDQLVKHAIELKKIGFLGILYGMNHVSVRVPSLTELAFGRLYKKHKDRYLCISLQRLYLVDDYQTGIDKLADAFRAFEANLGIICWYGEDKFEIMLVSSSANDLSKS
ncbi:hypothetical protein HY745_00920 [Candidatus Desantisbacteria bacterium]|nr:hypothetical protein [Candidatus Desantisbacteria bacterium]